MKKRMVCSLISVLLAGAMLTGCGGSSASGDGSSSAVKESSAAGGTAKTSAAEENPPEEVTIHFWSGLSDASSQEAQQRLIDAFEEKYKDKGYKVEAESFVNDSNGNLKLEANLLGGDEIDVYVSYSSSTLFKRAEGNLALDLTDLCQRDGFDIESYAGDMMEYFRKDGKAYCLPVSLSKFCMVLNKDMFDAAGIEIPESWTYDEFLEVCKKLTHGEGEDKVYGMFWNTNGGDKSAYAHYMSAKAFGGDYYYKEGGTETNFDDPIWQKTIELINTTMQEGYAPTHADTVTEKLTQESMFLTGRAAMCNGSWVFQSIKDTQTYPHDFVTAFAPFPAVDEEHNTYIRGGYQDLLSINPRSEHIDEAWEFMKFYMNEGALYMADIGRIPASNTYDNEEIAARVLGSDGLFDEQSAASALIDPSGNYAVSTILEKTPQITDVFQEEMEAVWTGNKTVEEGLASAKKRGDEILAKE